jgi:osmotically-inducible protein OsmY
MLPSGKPTGVEKDDLQEMARLLAEGLDDLHLAERVERALRATGYGPLRSVDVTAHARLIILEGRIPSYYLKQIAQSIALTVQGVEHVKNDLEVGRPK